MLQVASHPNRSIPNKKIFVFTSGRVELKKESKKILLEKFDALNSFSDEIGYEINCLADSDFFLISCEKYSEHKNEKKIDNKD